MASSLRNGRGYNLDKNDLAADTGEQRPAKRARVAVACTRCKTRKQKCDGIHPACGNCQTLSTNCEYVVPTKTMPRVQYVKALEARVAELETHCRREGSIDHGSEKWKRILRAEVLEAAILPEDVNIESNLLKSVDRCSETPGASDPNSVSGMHKDLSSEAVRGYIGVESSNITVGNMFNAVVKMREPERPRSDDNNSGFHPSLNLVSCQDHASGSSSSGATELSQINPDIAETLLHAYLKHISTRWPIFHSIEIRDLHARRELLIDAFDISTLNLIYTIAGRFLETTGVTGNFFPEKHYIAATKYLERILEMHDLRAVQTLLLHAIYCLRSPRSPGAWTHIGLATRLCIELGVHRKAEARLSRLDIELRHRIFWSCYGMDRQVSIILGRPFAISDRDIDAELPLDIDEGADESSISNYDELRGRPRNCSTLSCFIHMTRLRRIESNIQQTIYRVDKPLSLSQKETDRLLEELETWKAYIPSDNRTKRDTETTSYEGYDYYMIYYYKCLRLLLYPHIISSPSSLYMVQRCAEACGGVCQTYKRLHQQTSVGFSLMALYSVFLSGLTLVYCIWVSPKEVFTISMNNDINACSIVLYVITERWPGARKFRDAFESIKQYILDLIAAKERPRQPPENIDTGLRETLENVRNLHPQSKTMVEEMFGDEMSWPRTAVRKVTLTGVEHSSQEKANFNVGMTASFSNAAHEPHPGGEGIFLEDMQMPLNDGFWLDDPNMEEFLAQLNPMGL